MPVVALIDAEAEIVDSVKRGLIRSGLRVLVARDGDTGLGLALSDEVELVVLDLMLPGRSGIEILRAVQHRRPWIPVIVLSAQTGINDRLEVLRAGAVDYLVKPFVVDELEARIRSQLRMARRRVPATRLRHGDLTIDLLAREVTRDGRPIRLSPTEFDLLACFVQNAGKVLRRAQLQRAVWGYQHDLGTNLVDVYVGYLRRKVRGPDGPLLQITAVRSQGYRLELAD